MLISYGGIVLGALNTLLLFPMVFPDNPEVMGTVNTVLAVAMVIGTLGNIGMPVTLINFFPRINQKEQEHLWSWAILFSGIVSIAIALVLVILFLMGRVTSNLGVSFFAIACSILFFELFLGLSHTRFKLILPQFLKGVFRKLLITIILGTSILIDIQDSRILFFLAVGYIIHVVILAFALTPYFPLLRARFRFSEARPWLRFGLIVTLSTGVLALVSRMDVIMIQGLLNSESVAIYSICFFIGSVVGVPVRAMMLSFRKDASTVAAKNQLRKLHGMYKYSAILNLFFSALALSLVYPIAEAVLSWMPGAYYNSNSLSIVFVIGLSELLASATGFNGLVLNVLGRQKLNLYASIGLFAFNLTLNLILIPRFGVLGAAWATLISFIAFNCLKSFFLFKAVQMTPWSGPYGWLWFLIGFQMLVFTGLRALGFGFYVTSTLFLIMVLISYSLFFFNVIQRKSLVRKLRG